MKISTAFFTLALSINAVRADDTKPGQCVNEDDCKNYGKDFACVAVESNYPGLEKLNMCISNKEVCSGTIAGGCPTFSSWPSKFQKVMPVCAFLEVDNCNKKFDVDKNNNIVEGSKDADINVGDESASGSKASNETVECYTRNFTRGNEYKVVNGIYKCIDVSKYKELNGGHIQNFTDSQILGCGGNKTDANGRAVLCNGHGTCSPTSAFSEVYTCKCNKGFDAKDFCLKPVSNECSNLGQCGALGTCQLDQSATGTCSCKDGAKGDQCATCDASKDTCSDNGKCDAESGKCKCDEGYSGDFCQTASGNSDGSSDASTLKAVRMAAATFLMGMIAFV
jgi:hypothetical protein